MKKTTLYSLFFLLSLLVLASCSNNEEQNFHPNVQSFTSGNVSRFAPISLSFTEEIPLDKQTKDYLDDNIKISPRCDVSFTVTDNYIVTIQPKGEFKRDTEYKVKVNMAAFIDGLSGDLEDFVFKFKTLPLLCRGTFGDLTINEDSDETYDVSFTLLTADRESDSDAEALVRFSEAPDIVWSHSANGCAHTAIIKGIKPGIEERNLTCKLKNAENEKSKLSKNIPNINDFEVYDVVVRDGSEHCVSIFFTKKLDMNQDITGLAYIDGNSNERMQIEGNCIKIFYDEKIKGEVNIFVNKGIKSSKGLVFDTSAVFQKVIGNVTKPKISFVSQGSIIPLSSELTLQFRSVFMRGVVVRIIEVPAMNMGQFLQVSDLDSDGEIRRVGKLIIQKVIFLDDDPMLDLTVPHIFSLDLSKLFKANKGSMYRIELSGYSKLTAYPGAESLMASKSEIKAYFSQHFAEEKLSLDGSGYYYYFSNGDNYRWEDYADPTKEAYYEEMKVSKNVVATNLGIIAKNGADNNIMFWVNDIVDTKGRSGVKISVYDYRHYLIAEGRTNGDGYAELTYKEGLPYYAVAIDGDDISYLRLDDGSSLSMSDFETEGQKLQKGLGGFIYGDRGVWRPGDTLHLGFMLSDRAETLPKNHPISLEIKNPLGQVVARRMVSSGEMGIYAFNIPLSPDAPTGAWSAKVNIGGASFTKILRVETIMPNRLKISLDLGSGILKKGITSNGKLHTEWLNGAMARNLKYDVQTTFTKSAAEFNGYKDYSFENKSVMFQKEDNRLITGTTDEKGDSEFKLSFEGVSVAPCMLTATITTKVYEPSGQFSTDVERKQYSPYNSYVGINTPQKGKDFLETDKPHTIKFVVVSPEGKPLANKSVEVKIYKVDWYWWWSADDSYLADFTSDSYYKPVLTKSVTTDKNGNASFDYTCSKVDWGAYYIYAHDRTSGHSATKMAYFDWEGNPEQNGKTNAATRLNFKPDKREYNVGDIIKISIPSTEGAKALVSVENGSKVLTTYIYDCKETHTNIQIPVSAEMSPNAYINITLIQPYSSIANDMPIRLYGVAPVEVNNPDSHISPVIEAKSEVLPNKEFSVKVSEKGGNEMAYTVAIVDEGLLDLTHFKTPDPWKQFNAHEALGVRTWDAYNFVIGAYGGKIEQLFSIGGDDELDAAAGSKSLINRFTSVVKFAGPFHLKKGGSNTHKFFMPNYNGRVRVMVVAGNGNAYGNAEKSISVRQPVMVLGTLPRVISQGDEISVPATVFATKDGVGKVNVKISCSNKFSVIGNADATLDFKKIEDKTVKFSIKAGDISGIGTVTITAKSGNCESIYKAELEVRSISDEKVEVQRLTVGAGKEWKGQIKSIGINGTNSLEVELSGVTPINIRERMNYLTGYPHGCLEQLVSKAFPQIYLSKLVSMDDYEIKNASDAVSYALSRLSAYQMYDGSLAYWQGASTSSVWGSAYALHFMIEAENAGYNVPYSVKENLIKYISSAAKGWKPVQNAPNVTKGVDVTVQAYRLYVLALAGKYELGTLNRLKEESGTSLSQYLMAGAYALAGKRDAVGLILSADNIEQDSYYSTLNFGSEMRDNALRLQILCILDQQSEAIRLYNLIASELSSDNWLNTQEIAVALTSVAKFQDKYGKPVPVNGTINYDGKSFEFNSSVTVSKKLYSNSDEFGEMSINNAGKGPLFVTIYNKGVVNENDIKPNSNGLGLVVSYTDSDFRPIDVKEMAQGKNFIATVTVKNSSASDVSNVAVTQILPAGWEIIGVSGDGLSHYDIRDDRILSYIDFLPIGKQIIITVRLNASYVGKYLLPAVKCEAMYEQSIQANTSFGICTIR